MVKTKSPTDITAVNLFLFSIRHIKQEFGRTYCSRNGTKLQKYFHGPALHKPSLPVTAFETLQAAKLIRSSRTFGVFQTNSENKYDFMVCRGLAVKKGRATHATTERERGETWSEQSLCKET
ncbi:hypothetical protein CBL_07435 [Carabus blaptoides fortunei]